MGSACSHTNKSRSPKEVAISAPFPSAGLSKASSTTVESSYSQQTAGISESQTEISVTETDSQDAILSSLLLQTPPRLRSNKPTVKSKEKLSPMRRLFGLFKKKRKRDEVEEEVEKISELTGDSRLDDAETIVAVEAGLEYIPGVQKSSSFSVKTKADSEVTESDKKDEQNKERRTKSSADFAESKSVSTLKKSTERSIEHHGDGSEQDDFFTGADYSASDQVESLISVRDPGELGATYRQDFRDDIRHHAINLELLYHGRTLSPAEKDWLSQQVAGLVKILLDKGSIPENISFVDGTMRKLRKKGNSDVSYSESDSYLGGQMPAPSSHRKHRLRKLLELEDSDDDSNEEIDLSYDPHGTKYLKYEKREKRRTTRKYGTVIQELTRRLSEQNIKNSESTSSVNSFFTASDFNDRGRITSAEDKVSPKGEVAQKKTRFVRVRVNEYSGNQNLKSRCNSEPFIFAKSSEKVKKNVDTESVKTKPFKRESLHSVAKDETSGSRTKAKSNSSSPSFRVENMKKSSNEELGKERKTENKSEEIPRKLNKKSPNHANLLRADESISNNFGSENTSCTLVEKEYDFNGSSDSSSCSSVLKPGNDKIENNARRCESRSDNVSTQNKAAENRSSQNSGKANIEVGNERNSHTVKVNASRNSISSHRSHENRVGISKETSFKIRGTQTDRKASSPRSSPATTSCVSQKSPPASKRTMSPVQNEVNPSFHSGSVVKSKLNPRSPQKTSTPKKAHRTRQTTPVPMLESVILPNEGKEIYVRDHDLVGKEKSPRDTSKSPRGDYEKTSHKGSRSKQDAMTPVCRELTDVSILEQPPKPKPRSRIVGPVPSPRTRKAQKSISPREEMIKCKVSSRTSVPMSEEIKLIEMPRKQFCQMELPSTSPPIPDLQEIRSARIKSAQNHQRRLKKATEKRRDERNLKLKSISPPNVVALSRTPSIRKHRSKEVQSHHDTSVQFEVNGKDKFKKDDSHHKKSSRESSEKFAVKGDFYSSHSSHSERSSDVNNSINRVSKTKDVFKSEKPNISLSDMSVKSPEVLNDQVQTKLSFTSRKTVLQPLIDSSPRRQFRRNDTSQMPTKDKASFKSPKEAVSETKSLNANKKQSRVTFNPVPTELLKQESLPSTRQNYVPEQTMTQIFSNLDPLQINFQGNGTYSPFLNTGAGVANVPLCQSLQFGNATPTFSASIRPQVSAQKSLLQNFPFQNFAQNGQFGEPGTSQYQKFHFTGTNQNQILTWASPFPASSNCLQSTVTPSRINVSGCYFPNSPMTSNVFPNQQPFNYGINFANAITPTSVAFSPTENTMQAERDENPTPTLERYTSVPNTFSQDSRTSEPFSTPSTPRISTQPAFQSNKLSKDRRTKSVEYISNETEKKLSSSNLKHLTNSESHLDKSPQKHRKWRQCVKEKDEGDAWWMPKDWAKERGIGTYGNQWTFEKDDAEKKERELEIAKDANVEQIRMSRFISW